MEYGKLGSAFACTVSIDNNNNNNNNNGRNNYRNSGVQGRYQLDNELHFGCKVLKYLWTTCFFGVLHHVAFVAKRRVIKSPYFRIVGSVKALKTGIGSFRTRITARYRLRCARRENSIAENIYAQDFTGAEIAQLSAINYRNFTCFFFTRPHAR